MSNYIDFSIFKKVLNSSLICNKKHRFPFCSKSNQKSSTDFEDRGAGIVKLNHKQKNIYFEQNTLLV